MKIRIGLEKYPAGRILGYALDFPGCFAYGGDDAEVLLRLPRELLKYEVWIKDHTDASWVELDSLDFAVEEVFNVHYMDKDLRPALEGYEVNAFFRDDWHPLKAEEIEHVLLVHRWQRDELLAGVDTLADEVCQKMWPGERWNIHGIMKHIANAEAWYLDRLDLDTIKRSDMSSDPLERLDQTQILIEKAFPSFIDQVKVLGRDGEIWSCRKVVRRTLWHQRDHIEHIKQLAFRQ